MIHDARSKRATQRDEALQYLVEAVLDRSDLRSAAIVDADSGRVVAGAGTPDDLAAMARMAAPVARGEACPELAACDRDLFTRAVLAGGRTFYLAAIGDRVRRMTDAARAITRIVATTPA